MPDSPRIRPRRVACSTIVALALGCENGVAPVSVPEPLLQPACEAPAPVYGTLDPASPGFIVTYRSGTDAAAETSRLAAWYGFTPRHVYQTLPGFAAKLTPETVRGLRCEPATVHLTYDGRAGFASNP
jgi:hypothetical protein